jgi:hypothetical protein
MYRKLFSDELARLAFLLILVPGFHMHSKRQSRTDHRQPHSFFFGKAFSCSAD